MILVHSQWRELQVVSKRLHHDRNGIYICKWLQRWDIFLKIHFLNTSLILPSELKILNSLSYLEISHFIYIVLAYAYLSKIHLVHSPQSSKLWRNNVLLKNTNLERTYVSHTQLLIPLKLKRKGKNMITLPMKFFTISPQYKNANIAKFVLLCHSKLKRPIKSEALKGI